jgi:hypothetical protein
MNTLTKQSSLSATPVRVVIAKPRLDIKPIIGTVRRAATEIERA